MQNKSESDERGDTLIEVLIALVILAIAGVALLTAFATAITASSEHRHLATLDSSVRAASDQAISQVQQAENNAFGPSNCTNNPLGTSYTPTWSLSGSFTVTSYAVTYWNGSSFVPASALTNCTGYEPQLWTITIGSGGYKHHGQHGHLRPPAPTGQRRLHPVSTGLLGAHLSGHGEHQRLGQPTANRGRRGQHGNIVYSERLLRDVDRIGWSRDPLKQLLRRRERGHHLVQRLQL